MRPKAPIKALNSTGDKTIDVQILKVPDNALTAGSNVIDLSGAAEQTPWVTNINAAGYNLSGAGNITGVNVSGGYATTATAAATTTLTVTDKQTQVFTGATTQTVKLPVVSTLPQTGFAFRIVNNSSGAVTVQSSGANTIGTLAGGSSAWYIANALTGTGASVWTAVTGGGSQTPWTSDIDAAGYKLTGAGVIAGTNVSGGFATTATAAGTTTLVVTDKQVQEFTGTTTQTVVLPVVSTLPQIGYWFRIVNNSTGVVTVQSSGANTIQAMAAGTSCIFTANALSGTGASVWTAGYYPRFTTNSNLVGNNLSGGFATTATAAGTLTLTVADAQTQEFTGGTTHNCILPVVSTLPQIGFSFLVINNSTGIVTVKSSGANTVLAMAGNTAAIFIANTLSGTGASVWNLIPLGSATNFFTSLLGSPSGANLTLRPGSGSVTALFLQDYNSNTAISIGNRAVTIQYPIFPFQSPTQITADQNDYQFYPSLGAFLRLSTDASRNITGLVNAQTGAANGYITRIVNVGSQNIVLVHESASSTAANRFLNSTGADITLSANQAADVIYDATTARWRVYKLN